MGRPQQDKKLFGHWHIGVGTGLIAATMLSFANILPAAAQVTVETAEANESGSMHRTAYFELNKSICSNNWHRAIGLTSTLIGQDSTTATNRQALLSLRRQLDQLRAERAVLGRTQACDLSDPYVFAADPLAAPAPELGPEALGWDLAVAEAESYQMVTNEVVTESVEMTLPVSMSTRPGLLEAQPIDLSRGLNVVSGHVGTGHRVYGFVAAMGDRVSLNLEVTDVMTGTLYTSDDSQLFVFDREGRLIAFSDDDGEGAQSNIDGMIVPKTDAYFAVVTSYNNDPIYDQEGRLIGWQENGGGRFDYTLSVAGATPTQQLMR